MRTRHFTTNDGVAIAYGDSGLEDGTPVVLCHGLAANAVQFAQDAQFFAGLGFRVLTPDLRGHGQSDKAPINPDNYAIARLGDDLVAMLDDAAVGPVHWVGNSLGGIVALHMLRDHEHRFRTLATFGTSYRIALPRIGAHHLVAPVFRQGIVHELMGRATSRNPSAQRLITSMLREADPEVVSVLAGVLTNYDLIANGVAAMLPILLMRGRYDTQVNSILASTLTAMRGKPNFRLVENWGGHCANLDASDAVRAELLQFWKAN